MSTQMSVKVDGKEFPLATKFWAGKSAGGFGIQMNVDFLVWTEMMHKRAMETGDQDKHWKKGITAAKLMKLWVAESKMVTWEFARGRS